MCKFQIPNSKIQINSNHQNSNVQNKHIANVYDLEERTYQFAKKVSFFCKILPQTIANREYALQVIRSSSSVGANYIEANESLSKKDFIMRLKICRKEAKESAYWLRLIIDTNSATPLKEGIPIADESFELKKIFSSIIEKSK